jgi:hypothetical protein
MRVSELALATVSVALIVGSVAHSQSISETDLSGARGSWSADFTITVTAGQSLRAEIFGGTGDADLYVRRGAAPTLGDYESGGRPWLNGNDELVALASPVAGTYHVAIHAYRDYSGVALVVATGAGGGTGRPNKQAGEYAKQYGFDVSSLELGTRTFQLQQTTGGGRKDRIGHSSDYLPIYKGPLATEGDDEVADITLGFVDTCDSFKDEIALAAMADEPTSRKFDAAVAAVTGQNPNYTAYYLQNHYDPSAPRWTGLCHNWAPAGVLEATAQLVWSSDRIVGNQSIGVGDFRELVTAMLPNVRTYFIGARNNGMGVEDEDTDLDLADVIASLKYAIRDNDYGIVFDVTYTAEVWNQAVDHYTQSVIDGSGDAAVSGLIPAGGSAKRVSLTIPYTIEASYAHRGDTVSRTMQLDGYLIEDASGGVVDSVWITPTTGRPDFMWVPRGLFSGTAFQMLRALYDEGTVMVDVASAAEVCDKIGALGQIIQQGGSPSQADKDALQEILAKASKVIDPQKLDGLITSTADSLNIDRSELAAAVTGP